jgi:hypothetical protein
MFILNDNISNVEIKEMEIIVDNSLYTIELDTRVIDIIL